MRHFMTSVFILFISTLSAKAITVEELRESSRACALGELQQYNAGIDAQIQGLFGRLGADGGASGAVGEAEIGGLLAVLGSEFTPDHLREYSLCLERVLPNFLSGKIRSVAHFEAEYFGGRDLGGLVVEFLSCEQAATTVSCVLLVEPGRFDNFSVSGRTYVQDKDGNILCNPTHILLSRVIRQQHCDKHGGLVLPRGIKTRVALVFDDVPADFEPDALVLDGSDVIKLRTEE